MQNEMGENITPLVAVDYTPHLRLLLEALNNQPVFEIQPNALTLRVADIASAVVGLASERKNARRSKPLAAPFAYTIGTTTATVYHEDEQAVHSFGRLIEQLRAVLLTKANDALASSMLTSTSLSEYVIGLTTHMQQLSSEKPAGLHYPFAQPQTLQKRRMHLRSQKTRPTNSTAIRYRGHKLTITLENATSFDDDIIEALCTVLQERSASDEEIAETRAVLTRRKDDPTSEIARLKKLAKEESLGRLKMEAGLRFLRHLTTEMSTYQQAGTTPQREREGLGELQRFLHMLERFRAFLDDPSRGDSDYQVSYADHIFNIRSLFARSDSLDVLPIFSEVGGTLGETQNTVKDEQTYTYGLRMKLNGSVGTIPSTFFYYTSLLDPDSPDHQERLKSAWWNPRSFAGEVLQIAILYYALFLIPDDASFLSRLWEFLGRLRTESAQQTRKRLHWLSQQLQNPHSPQKSTQDELEKARLAIETFLRKPSVGPVPFSFYCYLTIRSGILRLDDDRMIVQKRFFDPDLFTSEERSKDALKYFAVLDAAPEEDALYALPVRLTFEPIYLSEIEEASAEKATMRYEVQDWHMLPILLIPNTSICQRASEQAYRKYRRVIIPYKEQLATSPDSLDTALYRFTFLLLTYLCLDILRAQVVPSLVQQAHRLFLPLLRIHQQKPGTGREQSRYPNEERVMRGFSKTLAHLLSQEEATLSNAQGLHVSALQMTGQQNYQLDNALSSLYNILPRLIACPPSAPRSLDRLAIIVISSRKSDAHVQSPFQMMCVYGEVIGCTRQPNGLLSIEQLQTFSVNETSDNLYTTPRTLLDEVRRCHKAGYRHILYVAKAPYTSTVHFTAKEEGEELFFMSADIIKGVLDAFPDLMLYPVYNDRYYVTKVQASAGAESLFIDDTSELRTLMTDPNKSSVVFWNVLNGILIQPRGNEKGHRYYNGVVSYATLINMYDNPLYDQAIRNNLLDGSQPGSLRADMLDFLSYLHCVRYERREQRGIQFKLDPYDGIIGFDSVGSRALLPSMDSRVRFNALAFLALVRGVLRRNLRRSDGAPAPSPGDLSTIPPASSERLPDTSAGETTEAQGNA